MLFSAAHPVSIIQASQERGNRLIVESIAHGQVCDVLGRKHARPSAVGRAVGHERNHFVVEGNWSGRTELGSITTPTLVLHGTTDPFLPFGHGEALAREIPRARLVALDGMGHQIPPPVLWDTVVPAIIEHTDGL